MDDLVPAGVTVGSSPWAGVTWLPVSGPVFTSSSSVQSLPMRGASTPDGCPHGRYGPRTFRLDIQTLDSDTVWR